jgi:hypothetical protein
MQIQNKSIWLSHTHDLSQTSETGREENLKAEKERQGKKRSPAQIEINQVNKTAPR